MKSLSEQEYKTLVNTLRVVNLSGARKHLTPEQEQSMQEIEQAIRLHDERGKGHAMKEQINVYSDLASTRCRPCGKTKGSGKSVCFGCWGKLPATIKSRLYNPENYPATVVEAYVYLEGKGVTCKS